MDLHRLYTQLNTVLAEHLGSERPGLYPVIAIQATANHYDSYRSYAELIGWTSSLERLRFDLNRSSDTLECEDPSVYEKAASVIHLDVMYGWILSSQMFTPENEMAKACYQFPVSEYDVDERYLCIITLNGGETIPHTVVSDLRS